MTKIKDIVIATTNTHKLREFTQLLNPFGLSARPAQTDWLAEAQETGQSFVENALIKARAVCAHTQEMVLADDSGLVVDALGGAPGILSARYAGIQASAEDNNNKLLTDLKSQTNRNACFYCAIVVVSGASDPRPLIFTGQWNGQITLSGSGRSGFGYDPLFYVPEHKQTAAEMSPEKKNRLSHRGRAVRQLLMHLCEADLYAQGQAIAESAITQQQDN